MNIVQLWEPILCKDLIPKMYLEAMLLAWGAISQLFQ